MRVSQISYIAADILEPHHLTAVSLLDGTPEGCLKAGDAQQFSGRLVFLTFLQIGQKVVGHSRPRNRRSASVSIASVFTACLSPIAITSTLAIISHLPQVFNVFRNQKG